MNNNKLTLEQLCQLVPQQQPFRFVERLVYVDEQEIHGTYTFKSDEFFYAGHFPQKPITPGVILLESMCQVGVVALGLYLLSLEIPLSELKNWLTMFTDANIEIFKSVYPNNQVLIKGKKIFWKKKKLRSQIEMYDQNNTLLAKAVASGMGIKI